MGWEKKGGVSRRCGDVLEQGFSGDANNARRLQTSPGGNPMKGAYLRANVFGHTELVFSGLPRLDANRGGIHTGLHGDDRPARIAPQFAEGAWANLRNPAKPLSRRCRTRRLPSSVLNQLALEFIEDLHRTA